MERLRCLNRNQIKYIVIIAMVIDHIAWAFVPTFSTQGMLMHFFGRLTGPTMAFFLAEGYLHTKDVKRYALRLCIFAVISWSAFSMFETGKWFSAYFGVIYTLFLGLLAIWIWDRAKIHKFFKITIVILLCILSLWGDWAVMDVVLPLVMVTYKDSARNKWIRYTLICVIWAAMAFYDNVRMGILQAGVLMVPVMLIFFYNGESGSRRPVHKWFFYVFYPLHLLILSMIKYNI